MAQLGFAQCGPRYLDDVFTTVNETSDITYGSAITFTGATQSLELDFYEPVGDTVSHRPLIVLAHGGFFLSGSKDDGDIDDLCRAYARKGYACASIEYRLGWSGLIPDSIRIGEALIRGVQDAKAAVRYFWQDAATTNTYRIDTNHIFMGGSSAGGFIGVHYAFLGDLTVLPAWAQSLVTSLGGVEGNSGNPGWPSTIQSGISYAGAIVDTTWMTNTGAGIVSTHSVNDPVVPYDSGPVVFIFFPIYDVQGASVFDLKAESLGVDHAFLSFNSAVHVPHVAGPAEFDATVDFTTDYLYAQLCDSDPACAIPENQIATILSPTAATLTWDPVPDAIGYQVRGGAVGGTQGGFTTTATSRTLNILTSATTYGWQVRAYCPPALSAYSAGNVFTTPAPKLSDRLEVISVGDGQASIQMNESPEEAWLSWYDLSGRLVHKEQFGPGRNLCQISNLQSGLYLIRYRSGEHVESIELMIP